MIQNDGFNKFILPKILPVSIWVLLDELETMFGRENPVHVGFIWALSSSSDHDDGELVCLS